MIDVFTQSHYPSAAALDVDIGADGSWESWPLPAAGWGLSSASFPLPPLGCELGLLPVASAPMLVSPFGDTTLEVTLPSPVPTSTPYMQLLAGEFVGQNIGWRLSNLVQTDT